MTNTNDNVADVAKEKAAAKAKAEKTLKPLFSTEQLALAKTIGVAVPTVKADATAEQRKKATDIFLVAIDKKQHDTTLSLGEGRNVLAIVWALIFSLKIAKRAGDQVGRDYDLWSRVVRKFGLKVCADHLGKTDDLGTHFLGVLRLAGCVLKPAKGGRREKLDLAKWVKNVNYFATKLGFDKAKTNCLINPEGTVANALGQLDGLQNLADQLAPTRKLVGSRSKAIALQIDTLKGNLTPVYNFLQSNDVPDFDLDSLRARDTEGHVCLKALQKVTEVKEALKEKLYPSTKEGDFVSLSQFLNTQQAQKIAADRQNITEEQAQNILDTARGKA